MTHSFEPSGFLPERASARAWRWRAEDGAGHDVSDRVQTGGGFPTQGDAESWIGEHWQRLADDGVVAVTLLEVDREVYGPMSLEA